jgi:hypothetical protein
MESTRKVILTALAVRLVLAPFFMHAGDVGTIYESSIMALNGQNLYDFVYQRTLLMQHVTGLPVFFEGYAYHPLLIYFFVPFYWIYSIIAGPNLVMIDGHYPSLPILVYPWTPILLVFLKMPIFLADMAVVYLLARSDLSRARIYAFCPYIIFISAIWGMFDAIVAVFLLITYLTYDKNTFVSGIAYGLSLVKLYTIVLLPLFLVRLLGKWREFATFLAGFTLTLLPLAYYLIISPTSFWNVLLTFQGTRVMGGVNLYNFIWIVPDVQFDLALSLVPNIILVISLILLLMRFGRKGPMLEAILAFMLAYFLFGRVLNEQFLVSIFPLMLLCRECDYRLWITAFVFIFLRSPLYYFALPILWASPVFYSYYLSADLVWRGLQAAGYLMIPMYAVGIAFSLLLLMNLQRILQSTPPMAKLGNPLGMIGRIVRFHSTSSKNHVLSRRVRILLK